MSTFPFIIHMFLCYAIGIPKTSHGWMTPLSSPPPPHTALSRVSRVLPSSSSNSYALQPRRISPALFSSSPWNRYATSRSRSTTTLHAQSRSRRRQRDVYDDNDDDYDDTYSSRRRDNVRNIDDDKDWDDYGDGNDRPSRSRGSSKSSNTYRRSQRSMEDEYSYDDEDESMYEGFEEKRSKSSSSSSSSPGAYNVYFKGSRFEDEEEQIEWELCDDGSTWVVLPPSYVSCPTAVVHFVGGTFFGSTPKLWYRTLIEELVSATKCTVVATSIPVTLLQNPLRHVSLSRKLQRQFQTAWMNILADEYDEEELLEVPVVGLGHSLGARLLTVLATLSSESASKRSSSSLMRMVPPYKAYVLISFNNFGASASVPGIASLLKESQSLEEDEQDDRGRRRPQSRSSSSRQRRRRRYDDEDDDFWDDEDEEWDELIDDIQMAVKEKASKVKSALTPQSKELEFHPTPDQLWEALKDDRRYTIPQTLVVQFQNDEVDQSPRLADCLVQTNSSDVKYAWLKGNHLTPVSAAEEGGEQGWRQWLTQIPTEASKAISSLARGTSGSSQRGGPSGAMRDLRQSIARYITDVVTKEN